MKKNVLSPVSVPVVFDFSHVDTRAKPADNASKDEKNEFYALRAGMQIDALMGAIDAHAGDVENIKRAVVTFMGDCTSFNYSLAPVAKAHPYYSQRAERSEAKVKNAAKVLGSLSDAERAELRKILGA